MISLIAKIVAHFRVNKIKKTYTKATKIQEDILQRLVKKAMKTKFGKDHGFKKISESSEEVRWELDMTTTSIDPPDWITRNTSKGEFLHG